MRLDFNTFVIAGPTVSDQVYTAATQNHNCLNDKLLLAVRFMIHTTLLIKIEKYLLHIQPDQIVKVDQCIIFIVDNG